MREIKPTEIKENPIELFGKDWALVTAGTPDNFNTMTISWGMIGNLWQVPVAMCYVRPQRYTHQFTEKYDRFTLSFFHPDMKRTLAIMGSKSGRDIDKMHYPGLDAVELPSGQIGYKQAKLIIECEKAYADVFKEGNFIDRELMESVYPAKDFHTFYIGRITHVWVED